MRRRIERLRIAPAAHEKIGCRHRAGNDALHAYASGCGPFAVDDHLTLRAVNHMAHFPGEIVVVLHREQNLGPELRGQMLVDQRDGELFMAKSLSA